MKDKSNKFINSTITNNKLRYKSNILITSFTILNICFGYKIYKKIDEYMNKNNDEVTHVVYFKLEKNSKYYGTIDIGLFSTLAPKSINNILTLASNENLKSYKNTELNRVVPRYMISLGQIKDLDKDFISIYDNTYIEDENCGKKFNQEGLVALCNKGTPNTNISQLFITLDDLPMLNNKFSIVGKVLKGYDLLKSIADDIGTLNGEPLENVKISECGIYNYEDYFNSESEYSL